MIERPEENAPRCLRHYEAAPMGMVGNTWRCEGPGHPAIVIGAEYVQAARWPRSVGPKIYNEAIAKLRLVGVQW